MSARARGALRREIERLEMERDHFNEPAMLSVAAEASMADWCEARMARKLRCL
jgi:hypothetical protein